jgi:membrane fusion protein (multidrug efflux system)
MFKKPVVWIVLLLVIMLGYLYFPQQEEAAGRGYGGGAPLVEVTPVKMQTITERITALGNAEANESVQITAQSTDRVFAIHFDDGDRVEQGQLLVTLLHDEEQAQVLELKVNLAEQKRQLQRLLDLEKTSAPAESAIDSQKSLMEATQAKLAVANILLQEKFIYAPFSGTLGLRQISPGQLVTNSTLITTLDDVDKIKVEFQLAEKYLTKVSIGQMVSAQNVAYKGVFTGEVIAIDSRIDKATRSFKVRALFDNENYELRPGMLLQLDVAVDQSQGMVVPESSVVPLNSEHYVYVLGAENTVSRVQVTVGKRQPGFAEITEGLEPGQRVISKGVLKVRHGSKVKLAKEG